MILLAAVTAMLVQIPQVQTGVGRMIANFLAKKSMDAEITFSQIKIKPFNTLIVKDLTIVDKMPYTVDTAALDPALKQVFRNMHYRPVDTLFRAENVTATFSLGGLTGKGKLLSSAAVRNAELNLTIEENGHSVNITRMFRIPEKQHKEVENKDILRIRKVSLEGMRLTMKNYRTSKYHDFDTTGINWNDMDIRDLTVHGRDLRLKGKVMSGAADFVTFSEKSGYRLDHLSANATVGSGGALIDNIRLVDKWSDVDLPHFSMHYAEAHDMAYFPDKIRIVAEVRPSTVSLMTLGYFSPKLGRRDFALNLKKASVDGTVAALGVSGLEFSTSDGQIRGTVDARLTGLPDIGSLVAEAKLKNVHLTSRGAQNIMDAFGGKSGGDGTSGSGTSADNTSGNASSKGSTDLSKYAPGIDFTLNGGLSGRANDLKFNGYVSSSSGSLVADMRVRSLLDKTAHTAITGTVRTSSLNLHRMADGIPVEECTMDASLGADLPAGGGASLRIDSLKVSGMKLNGYNYSNIFAAGTLAESRFDGKVVCNDPNLNFLFQGLLTVSRKTNNALYRFYANIGHADLHALNLDRRGRSEVDLQISADFTKTGAGVWLGEIGLADIGLTNSSGRHDIGDVKIESYSGNDIYQIRLNSGFAEGTFSGSASITQFLGDALGVTARRELPSLFKGSAREWAGDSYELSLRTTGTAGLLSFIAPGVYIADGTSLSVNLDRQGQIRGRLASQRIAYGERYIKDVDLSVSNADSTLTGTVNGESISLSPLMIKGNRLAFTAKDDRIRIVYRYDNGDGDKSADRGEIMLAADFDRDEGGLPTVDVSTAPSSFRINSKDWNIARSDIRLEGSTLSVNDFRIYSGEQSVKVWGRMSDSPADTLDITVTKFDLSAADALLGDDLDLKGTLTGRARVTSPKDARRLLLDFSCGGASIAGEPLGDISLATKWDDTFSKFHILAANDIDGVTSFSLYGTYTPSIRQIDVLAKLDSLNLAYTAPFLRSVFSEVGGSVSGDILISGSPDDISIVGRNPALEGARLKVAYTNVAYTASGPFHIDDYGVYFDSVTIADDYGNKGRLGGRIGFDHLKDMRFDMNIDLNRMMVIDLGEKDNDDFYGRLFASGTFGISGPTTAVTLSANVRTTGAGELHVPVSSTQNAGLTDLLKFKEPVVEVVVDPYEEYLGRLREEKNMANDLSVRLNVDADPQVEVWVEVDKASGNVLWGRGTGSLDITVRPNANVFNITGDYTLNSGNYHFVALGLASRDFSINDGSSIRFNGDVMSSTLDIDASYKTKVSLATLIADTTSTNTRRTVECGISVTDKLSNPRLAFSINIPDLDPTVKAQVESALSTEDKVQKQFLALLISNSFIPDEQSSIVNSSSVLFSNVSEIMSNQLNTILQKLNIPLDLGVNYQQTDSGNDVFDVAVSTQLFNNRVLVNGNIGNRQYQSSSSGSEVAGDLDIEIKLDRAGSYKLTLFSHSADQYTNYLDDTQRNGVGFTYQQEFNRFGQWVRRAFTSRKKRRERDAEEAMTRTAEETVEIRIGEK